MPMWAPPTPPQDENDVYVDYCMCFLYEPSIMPESQLPPVYIKREHKRLRVDTSSVGRKQKVRKDEAVCVPRSLFDRPTAAVLKMRRDAKMQKIRGLPRPPVICGYKPPAVVNKPIMDTQQDHPEWLIHEDWALLQAVQTLLELPLSLTVLSPAHTPNWDMVAEVVNATGRIYRSPKQCKGRYESVIVPREEGKILYDTNPKKQKKSKGIYRTKNNRPMRTSQLFIQDNNSSFSHLYHMRFETIKSVANKRTPTLKPLLVNPTLKNPKHAAVLAESNINYEQPLTPMQVATIRAERIAREKQKTQAAAAAATAELQLAAHRQQQQQQQQQQHQAALAQAQQVATGSQQVGLTTAQQLQISVATAAASSLPGTATSLGSLCTQRGTAAGVSVRNLAGTNPQTVVSLTPAQVQAATQRITAANLASVTTGSVGAAQTQATTVATKNLTVQQIQTLRTQTLIKQQQQQQQQQRLQQRLQQAAQQQQQAAVAAAAQQQGASAAAAVAAAQAQAQKGSVAVSSPLATAAGVAALQVSQAQQRVQVAKQVVKPTRAMSDADLMQLIKRQPKTVATGAGTSVAQIQVPAQGQVTTQLLTHAQLQQMQQQAAAGQTQVATLVKTVSTPTALSGSPSVTIPMSAVSLSIPNMKATVAGSKMATVTQQTHLRQIQLQQQLLQRKMQQQQQQQQSQKVAQLAQQAQGKSQLPTQLGTVQIVQQAGASSGHAQKQLSTVTVQQIQQVIKQVPQQNIQHMSQVTASGGSSLVTQSAAVSSAQVLGHGLLAKPTQATVTLAQSVAPTTVTAALHASSAGQSLPSGQTMQARVIPAASQSVTPVVAASIASPAAAAAAAAAQAAAIKQTIQVVSAAAGSPGLSPAQVQATQMRGQVSTVGGQPLTVAVRTTTPLQQQHVAAGSSQTLSTATTQLPSQVPHSTAATALATAPVTLATVVGQNPASGTVAGAPATQAALQQAKLQAAQQVRSSSYTMRLRNPPKQ